MSRFLRLAGFCVALVLGATPAIAQDVSGTWEFDVELDVGGGSPTFVFQQDGETLSGTYQGTFGDADVTGTVSGNDIEFTFEVQGATATYTGTISGDTMEGSCDYGGVGSGTWQAEKVE